MPLAYSTCEAASPADVAVVDEGLDRYNRATPALADVRALSVIAKDDAGRVVGGAVGRTWGRCCELQQLWVDPAHRRSGVGRELVRCFEAEVRARGCSLVYLDTFSFQAPAFYARLGFREVTVIRGYPGDIVRYSMQKVLPDDAVSTGPALHREPPGGSS